MKKFLSNYLCLNNMVFFISFSNWNNVLLSSTQNVSKRKTLVQYEVSCSPESLLFITWMNNVWILGIYTFTTVLGSWKPHSPMQNMAIIKMLLYVVSLTYSWDKNYLLNFIEIEKLKTKWGFPLKRKILDKNIVCHFLDLIQARY